MWLAVRKDAQPWYLLIAPVELGSLSFVAPSGPAHDAERRCAVMEQALSRMLTAVDSLSAASAKFL